MATTKSAQGKRQKNPNAKTETLDLITMHVEPLPDKTVLINWHVETGSPTVNFLSLRCNRNTGNIDFVFPAAATGCTGANVPKDGGFIDFGSDVDPNNNFQTYSSPFKSGDKVTYQVVGFIVTATERYPINGPRITVQIP